MAIRIREMKTSLAAPSSRNTIRIQARRFWISGDPGTGAACRKKLVEKKFTPAESESDAEFIIYCEGPQCDWKSIIQIIGSDPGKRPHYFHGSGTHSIIGSAFPRAQGDVIEL
jgi:hypothetical protein